MCTRRCGDSWRFISTGHQWAKRGGDCASMANSTGGLCEPDRKFPSKESHEREEGASMGQTRRSTLQIAREEGVPNQITRQIRSSKFITSVGASPRHLPNTFNLVRNREPGYASEGTSEPSPDYLPEASPSEASPDVPLGPATSSMAGFL